MSEEEFINNVEGHITSLKNLDNKALKILVGKLEEENKKLKHENRYRAGIVDILPKWKGHIAEETIQDLQKRIDELLEENENLKAIIDHYKKFEEWKNKLEWMLMEEDTLQELRDLGKI